MQQACTDINHILSMIVADVTGCAITNTNENYVEDKLSNAFDYMRDKVNDENCKGQYDIVIIDNFINSMNHDIGILKPATANATNNTYTTYTADTSSYCIRFVKNTADNDRESAPENFDIHFGTGLYQYFNSDTQKLLDDDDNPNTNTNTNKKIIAKYVFYCMVGFTIYMLDTLRKNDYTLYGQLINMSHVSNFINKYAFLGLKPVHDKHEPESDDDLGGVESAAAAIVNEQPPVVQPYWADDKTITKFIEAINKPDAKPKDICSDLGYIYDGFDSSTFKSDAVKKFINAIKGEINTNSNTESGSCNSTILHSNTIENNPYCNAAGKHNDSFLIANQRFYAGVRKTNPNMEKIGSLVKLGEFDNTNTDNIDHDKSLEQIRYTLTKLLQENKLSGGNRNGNRYRSRRRINRPATATTTVTRSRQRHRQSGRIVVVVPTRRARRIRRRTIRRKSRRNLAAIK